MALFRIAAATALLCWVAPQVPRSVFGSAPSSQAEAVRAARETATDLATRAAESFCADQPERCIALAASAVALGAPGVEPKSHRSPKR